MISPASESFDEFQTAIRAVVVNDWDPHNAGALPEAQGTYNLYVRPLASLIRNGAAENEIVAWLHEREAESMCFPPLGTQRLIRIARKLLDIKREP